MPIFLPQRVVLLRVEVARYSIVSRRPPWRELPCKCTNCTQGVGEMKQVTEVGLGHVPRSSQIFCEFYLKFGHAGYKKTDTLAVQIHCNIFKTLTICSTITISGYTRRRDLYKSLNPSALWKRESLSAVKQISDT